MGEGECEKWIKQREGPDLAAAIKKKGRAKKTALHELYCNLLSVQEMNYLGLADEAINRCINNYSANERYATRDSFLWEDCWCGLSLVKLCSCGKTKKQDQKDETQRARGIYYHDALNSNRADHHANLFLPSLEDHSTPNTDRTKRAQILAKHTRDNETYTKSEYAREADA
jgi:hypothetical protein